MHIDLNNLDDKSKAILFGLFLSKFDRVALSSLRVGTFTLALKIAGIELGVSPNTILIHRNKFDSFFPNGRNGFRSYKEAGLLREYEVWIEKTQEWSIDYFLDIFKPMFDSQEVDDANWKLTRNFERLSKAFDKAFGRMIKNVDKYIGDINLSHKWNQDDHSEHGRISDIEIDYSQYMKALLVNFDATFEKNHKYFEDYRNATIKLFDFMRDSWAEGQSVLLDDEKAEWHYYLRRYVLRNSIIIRRALSTAGCDALNMICSYSIVDHLRNIFAINYVRGDLYDLQRFFVNKACSVLDNKRVYRFRLGKLIDMTYVLASQDKDSLLHLLIEIHPTDFHPSKINPAIGSAPRDLEYGVLFAELASFLFGSKNSEPRTTGLHSYDLTINNGSISGTISGDFEFPCKMMGYLAKSNNGNIILGFRGTIPCCIKHDITDLWQILIGPETSYLCALGLLLELRDKTDSNTIIKTYGHSLGGGLSQFAVAVATAKSKYGIEAYCYNSAGLRGDSLDVFIKSSYVFSNISHLCHKSDLVHRAGYLLGSCFFVGEEVCKMEMINKCIHYHALDTIIEELGFNDRLILISDLI